MDLAFFGFREPPFGPTPNPKFLHLTQAYREALAQLRYGVEQRKGFILLTGEIGTGKTTLLRVLLTELGESTAVAVVTNTMLGFDGILEYVLEDLGIQKPAVATPAQRIVTLQNFLVERYHAGQNTVLIIDEAQDLDVHALEQIRLLSNFETMNEKILQIVLVGQPELRAKLALPELRQLKQRIGLRCHLRALEPDQVPAYIRTRIRVAGGSDLWLFTRDAMKTIGKYSGGIPRLINTVCDHCLLFAYADQVRHISQPIVDEVIAYLDEQQRTRWWRMTPLRWTGLAASAVVVAGLAAQPRAIWWVFDVATSSFSHVARSMRALLPL